MANLMAVYIDNKSPEVHGCNYKLALLSYKPQISIKNQAP